MKKAMKKKVSGGCNDPLELLIRYYLQIFLEGNRAGRVVEQGLKVLGIGLRPLVDHITFRTMNVEKRAKEFLKQGYRHDARSGVLKYETWWGKIYRKAGYPAVFIDQPYAGKKGKDSEVAKWVEKFGDERPYHLAVCVDNIEQAVYYMEKQGIPFTGKVLGAHEADLRQAFAQPEIKEGIFYSIFELTERHRGNTGLLPKPQLISSTDQSFLS